MPSTRLKTFAEHYPFHLGKHKPVFEKNRPATFRHPLYSFLGDWAMVRDTWLGRIEF